MAVLPPQFPVDIMTTLAEMAGTIVALTERIRKLEENSAIHYKELRSLYGTRREGE